MTRRGDIDARIIAKLLTISALMWLLPMGAFAQGETSEAEVTEAATESSEPAYTLETIPSDDVIGDFVVGPGKSEVSLKPGDTAIVEIIITNRMGRSRIFNFEVEDFVGSNDPNMTIRMLGDEYGPYTLKDYLKIPEKGIELQHAERARVPIEITIPEDAEPGGRYGSVLVNTVSAEAKDATAEGALPQSALIARIGTLFFVTIEGDIEREGKLDGFSTIPKKKWFQSGPIRFEIRYENTGSIHVNPYGEIRINNILGEEVGFIEVLPWFAMPDSLRYREVAWEREFLFGKYTATANINRGYDDIVDTMTVEFWVLPSNILIGTFVGLFIVFFLIRLFFKKFEFRRKSTHSTR